MMMEDPFIQLPPVEGGTCKQKTTSTLKPRVPGADRRILRSVQMLCLLALVRGVVTHYSEAQDESYRHPPHQPHRCGLDAPSNHPCTPERRDQQGEPSNELINGAASATRYHPATSEKCRCYDSTLAKP